MPTTVYMQVDPRHDHVFSIPDPALTAATGVTNACQACHPAGSGVDVAGATRRWWPTRSTPNPRTLALVRARAGNEQAIPQLITTTADPAPAWRAAAALHLQPWLDRADVRGVLLPLLTDPDPLVRFAAADALAPAAPLPDVESALRPLLTDPVRVVRVSASRALRFRLSPSAAPEYAAYLQLHLDDPTALLERGTWALETGQTASARMDLEAARGLDPNSVQVLDALALLAARSDRPADAVELLTNAVRLAPGDADVTFRLALAQAGVGDEASALQTLSRVVELDPGFGRAWYNLGLLQARQGGGAGLEALRTAARLDPADPEVGYGLAATLAPTDPRAAADEARRILTLDPQHPGARDLLSRLVP
jgi:tetratricopeptide (TPR) repeat protein